MATKDCKLGDARGATGSISTWCSDSNGVEFLGYAFVHITPSGFRLNNILVNLGQIGEVTSDGVQGI